MSSFRKELIELLTCPVTGELLDKPILWDGQTFSASGISDMINTALAYNKKHINNPLTRREEKLDDISLEQAYFPENITENIIVGNIMRKFGEFLKEPSTLEDSKGMDKYLSKALYEFIMDTKASDPKSYQHNIIVKKLEAACKKELEKEQQEEFFKQRREFHTIHAEDRHNLGRQEEAFRKQLEDARKDAGDEVVRKQLAREALLARTKTAWGASPRGVRGDGQGSFSFLIRLISRNKYRRFTTTWWAITSFFNTY